MICFFQQHLLLHRYHHPYAHMLPESPRSSRESWSMSMAENIPNGSGKHGPAAPAAVKIAAPANGWTRKDRPCDACRRRKGRCIIPQDTETCIMCQSRSEECTFVETPQRRKRRKLEEQGSPESAKPHYVTLQNIDSSY